MAASKKLSTPVDKTKKTPKSPRVPAAQTRERILAAARAAFCQAGFDQVGVRELAHAAGVDPAVVIRLFGSKEALFTAIARDAFTWDTEFGEMADDLATHIAEHLTGDAKHEKGSDGFDEFHFLLRSAASPVAGPILSEALHAGFVYPLAQYLGGEEANQRAAMLSACILGFATLRVALGSPALEGDEVTGRLKMVLEACLETCD